MTVTPLRQPAPTHVETIEQAARIIEINPDPACPETAWSLGFLDGKLTGLRYAFDVATDADRREHDRHLSSPESFAYRPLPLVEALTQTDRMSVSQRAQVLRGSGWLHGFAAETAELTDATSCGVCSRRLLLDSDSAFHCERDGEWLCYWHGRCEHTECGDGGEL